MTDRARLQWASADWPAGGRFDSKGTLLGGQVLLRLDLISAFEVRCNLFCQPQATLHSPALLHCPAKVF